MADAVALHAAASPGELRVAAIAADGRLVDYAVSRAGAPDLVGAVLAGRVRAAMPALAGAFVALDGAGDGFLPDSAGARGLGVGDAVTVRVTRAAQGGKGPRLALDPGPPRGPPDALERLAARHPEAAIRIDDPALAALHRARLGDRLAIVAAAFPPDIEDQVAALADPTCPLPGGGRMTITPTPALTAIDLDLGTAASGRASKTAAHVQANAASLPEVARQIRLRALGGAIVVDLAGLSPRRRAALAPALHAALADDARFLGFTALGLAEILRPRVHPPLHELLGSPHGRGLAGLRALARAAAADPARPQALRVAADIGDALAADAAARADFTRLSGRKPALRTDRALPPGAWLLEPG